MKEEIGVGVCGFIFRCFFRFYFIITYFNLLFLDGFLIIYFFVGGGGGGMYCCFAAQNLVIDNKMRNPI